MRAGGRWHSAGRPIVYCAEHPASALLEILAHLEVANLAALPDGYQLLEIDIPDRVEIESLPTHALALKWQSDETSTQSIGDRWLASRSAALLRVPSALVPKVWNYLVNPAHPAAAQLRINAAARYPFDTRLFKLVGGARRRPAARMRVR
ncbi:MAG: RES family NAD+ phosphorylase [Pseudomonadota bacterium]|nr:RES family NAD+ phosphorylase [Pseudomonadota bacterium]